MAASYQNTEAKILDVSSEKELGSLIDESELVLRSVGWWQSGRRGESIGKGSPQCCQINTHNVLDVADK